MKLLNKLLIIVFVFIFGLNTFAQKQEFTKETFKVWGNCEMCKTTIEKSLRKFDGVKSARWNVSTKQITVKYNAEETNLEAIKKQIASVGYDTEEFKADDKVYSKLHHCCQYDRK